MYDACWLFYEMISHPLIEGPHPKMKYRCNVINRFSLISLLLLSSSIVDIEGRSSRVTRSARKRASKKASNEGSSIGATAMGEAAILMKSDRHWIIPPLDRDVIRSSTLAKVNRNLAEYVADVLGSSPLVVHLDSKPVQSKSSSTMDGKGDHIHSPSPSSGGRKYKATVTVGSHIHHKPYFLTSQPKALRAVWSSTSPAAVQESSQDLVTKSYEECSMGFRNLLELEVILPKTRHVSASPIILYTFPMEAGSMNKASRLAMTRGQVQVFPRGRTHPSSTSSFTSDPEQVSDDLIHNKVFHVGLASLHIHSPPSLIDWTWAKGKILFWRGRSVGQV